MSISRSAGRPPVISLDILTHIHILNNHNKLSIIFFAIIQFYWSWQQAYFYDRSQTENKKFILKFHILNTKAYKYLVNKSKDLIKIYFTKNRFKKFFFQYHTSHSNSFHWFFNLNLSKTYTAKNHYAYKIPRI